MCYQKSIPDIVPPPIYELTIHPEFIPPPPGVIPINEIIRDRAIRAARVNRVNRVRRTIEQIEP